MTASLQTKNGNVYVVLNWKQGINRKQKWIKTDLPLKYGKRMGDAAKRAALEAWEPKLCVNYTDIKLGDFLKDWVERRHGKIEDTTYREYRRMISNTIAPYFDGEGVTLQSCSVRDIERFYKYRMKVDGVSANTISHHQACLYAAFKDACRLEILNANPASKVELPKVHKYRGAFCTVEEAEQFLKMSKGAWLEMPIYLAIWFGMRRGEIAGLRWKDINFPEKTMTVSGVMVYNTDNAKQKNQYRGRTTPNAQALEGQTGGE